MRKYLRVLVIVMLLINAAGALTAGWSFIAMPDGSGIGMSLKYLEHSPFDSYLVPGLVLFLANGIFSVWTLMTLLFGWRTYPYYVLIQGTLLTGWIAVQTIMVRDFNWLHFTMGLIGLLLIASGYLLRNGRNNS